LSFQPQGEIFFKAIIVQFKEDFSLCRKWQQFADPSFFKSPFFADFCMIKEAFPNGT
jgi:hypothetical protein